MVRNDKRSPASSGGIWYSLQICQICIYVCPNCLVYVSIRIHDKFNRQWFIYEIFIISEPTYLREQNGVQQRNVTILLSISIAKYYNVTFKYQNKNWQLLLVEMCCNAFHFWKLEPLDIYTFFENCIFYIYWFLLVNYFSSINGSEKLIR